MLPLLWKMESSHSTPRPPVGPFSTFATFLLPSQHSVLTGPMLHQFYNFVHRALPNWTGIGFSSPFLGTERPSNHWVIFFPCQLSFSSLYLSFLINCLRCCLFRDVGFAGLVLLLFWVGFFFFYYCCKKQGSDNTNLKSLQLQATIKLIWLLCPVNVLSNLPYVPGL